MRKHRSAQAILPANLKPLSVVEEADEFLSACLLRLRARKVRGRGGEEGQQRRERKGVQGREGEKRERRRDGVRESASSLSTTVVNSFKQHNIHMFP